MAEKDKIYSSKIKYNGIFSFSDFYKFCFNFLKEEGGFGNLVEEKYSEKLSGTSKDIDIEWSGSRDLTDYFKAEIKVVFKIIKLTEVEINDNGVKIKTNNGSVELSIKGTLVRDPKGNFEKSPFLKFLRGRYEKFVIPERVKEFQDKISGDCDEFLSQAKAFLDLEGKK
jgi:hypothetical protein